MSLFVSLRKRAKSFQLDMEFSSDSRRIGILGASGCGKSMTLRSIAGVEQPDGGRIVLDGRVLYDGARVNVRPQERRVGYLFQNYALFPTMSVLENVMAGMRVDRKQRRKKAEEMIAAFQLAGQEDKLPCELSGGQQQRTALARMLAAEPRLILLDEPFAALDEYLRDQMQQELLELLSDYRGQVILVSHNRDEIYRLCEYLIVMADGKKVCEGPTGELFANPCYVEAARLTGCKNIAAARRLDDSRLYVPDWNATVRSERPVSEEITHIGIRAHDFVPLWHELPENALPFCVGSTASLPFEQKYFLKPVRADAPEICWFVQRDTMQEIRKKGLPRGLVLPPERVLLLREGGDRICEAGGKESLKRSGCPEGF